MESVFREHLIPFLELQDLLALSLTCKFWRQTLDDLLSVEWQRDSLTLPLAKVAFRYLIDKNVLSHEYYKAQSFYLTDMMTLVRLFRLLLNGASSTHFNGRWYLCCKTYKPWTDMCDLTKVLLLQTPLCTISAQVPGGTASMGYLLRTPEAMKGFLQYWT